MGYTLTADLLTLYFTSNRPGFGGFDLYITTRPNTSSPWASPTRVSEVSSIHQDLFPTVSGDGNTLVFCSNRPGSVPAPGGEPSFDLWVAMRADASTPFMITENLFEVNTEFN